MNVRTNVSLKKYNTFGIDVKAKYLLEINNFEELNEFISDNSYSNIPKLIIGEGSNILFTEDYDGIVIKIKIKGIEILEDNSKHVLIKAYAGEKWDDLVKYSVQKNYAGIENLSYIPGSVGSAPVQNIGAFGSEAKDTIINVEFFDLLLKKIHNISNADCHFDYRDSIFKHELKNNIIITSVTFKLNKNFIPNINYPVLKNELIKNGGKKYNITDIRDSIIKIRTNKIPDPSIIGNAGSFFKNPTISLKQYEKLKIEYPNIVAFDCKDKNIKKISAGWLIEATGWKGKRIGNVGTHNKQALIILNYNNATGMEILNFTKNIQESVFSMFGIKIEREVIIIGKEI
jgi:UDP-N-acetylmuramate dehydrogenase